MLCTVLLKRFSLPLLGVLLAFALSSCFTPKVQKFEHNVIEVPDGRKSRTISIAGIKSSVPKGTHVGKLGLGWGCPGLGKNYWQHDKSAIADEDMKEYMYDVLKSANYNVLGDPSDLFEDKSAKGELLIAGRIVELAYDICFLDGARDDFMNGSSFATLTVEWQVYDALDKKTIFKITKKGSGEYDFADGRPKEAVRKAIADSLRGALSDKNFYTVIMKDDSAGSMGVLTDGKAKISAPQSGAQSATVFMSKTKGLPVVDFSKAVVVVQIPGGHGSGFFIDSSGHIITNQHVVGDNDKVRIVLHNGQKLEGVVLSRDVRRDVALVKVDTDPQYYFGVRVGEAPVGTEVYAIGAPIKMEMQGTVTRGIVSGYRTVEKSRMLQSDAAIYGGNSGGPLVDSQGKVVGVCQSRMTATQGFNFFVPIDEALEKMNIGVK